jgi:hypothetical protein
MASNLARDVMWAVAGGLTSKVVRRATHSAMHTDEGHPRLPGTVRRSSGLGTVLLWAAGTGALLALADVMREEQKQVRRRA